MALVPERLSVFRYWIQRKFIYRIQRRGFFFSEAIALAEKAKDKALTHRRSMSSPELAKEFVLTNTAGDKQNIWACLNKGLACLHASDFQNANIHIGKCVAMQG